MKPAKMVDHKLHSSSLSGQNEQELLFPRVQMNASEIEIENVPASFFCALLSFLFVSFPFLSFRISIR